MSQQILGRFPVTKRESSILRSQETGILVIEPATPWLDGNVRWQPAGTRPHQLGDCRPEERIRDTAVLGIATLNARDTGGMRIVLRAHIANQSQLVHDRSGSWHQFADIDPRKRCRDLAKRAAKLSSRLGIPAFVLTHPPVDPDEQHLLFFRIQFGSRQRTDKPSQATQSQRACTSNGCPQPLPT